MKRNRVILADDHAVFRQSIRAFLENTGSDVLGEAANGHACLAEVRKRAPDLVVLDQSMPVMDGITAARHISRRYPEIGIVLLTMYDDEHVVSEALAAGVAGYVMKHQAGKELTRAMDVVSSGEFYLSPSLPQGAHRAAARRRRRHESILSWRERQILQLIAEGHSTKQMACLLDVSFSTAESHRMRIMQKLGIHHIAGLTCYAVRERIIRL